MKLEEFKKRIDEMYEKYGGNIEVDIDITLDEEIDDELYINDKAVATQNIQDITEVKNMKYEVIGITISNYIMEDNNWGQEK